MKDAVTLAAGADSHRAVDADGGGIAAPADAETIAAALHWWQLAGVDCITGAARSWFDSFPAVALAPEAAPDKKPSGRTPTPEAAQPAEDWQAVATLDDLRARLPGVPLGDGNPASGLMIIGDSPSVSDWQTGRPFSGPIGGLLDAMLQAIGLDRQLCYISLLCPRQQRPGASLPQSIATDLPLTLAHIQLVAPRLLLLLGSNPARVLSGEDAPISRLRGQWLRVTAGDVEIPALAMVNPGFLRHRPQEKRLAWADLLSLKRRLAQ